MPLDVAIATWGANKLVPVYRPEDARETPVNLQPSTVYPRGTLLGNVANAANDVQTLTVTGAPTGGTFTVSVTNPVSGATGTFNLDFNSSAAAAQTAARAAAGQGTIVAASGGPLPGSTIVFNYSGNGAGLPVAPMTVTANNLTGGSTPAASFAHTTQGRTAGSYGAYVDAGATDPAAAVLSYDCATDSAGNITMGLVAGVTEHGQTFRDVPAYVSGYFLISELVGYDAAGGVNLGKVTHGGKVLCITGP